MTIEEALAAKVALKNRLELALREFTRDTGLMVNSLEVNQSFTHGKGYNYFVYIDIKL